MFNYNKHLGDSLSFTMENPQNVSALHHRFQNCDTFLITLLSDKNPCYHPSTPSWLIYYLESLSFISALMLVWKGGVLISPQPSQLPQITTHIGRAPEIPVRERNEWTQSLGELATPQGSQTALNWPLGFRDALGTRQDPCQAQAGGWAVCSRWRAWRGRRENHVLSLRDFVPVTFPFWVFIPSVNESWVPSHFSKHVPKNHIWLCS